MIISKALDYKNVKTIFTEDHVDKAVTLRSLNLLEMFFLMLEGWVQTV